MNSRISTTVGRFVFQNTSRCFMPGVGIPSNNFKMASSVSMRSMSSINDRFTQAQANLKSVTDQGNDVKLKLYGLFKQATVGKNTTKKPGMMDMVGKAKWDAWNSIGDISQEEAQKQYAELVESLVSSSAADNAPKSSGGAGFTVEVKDGVRTILLARPTKKNALTQEMYDGVRDALIDANTDNSTRIVVLTGSGDFYCSGNDLGNFANVTDVKKMAEEAKIRMMKFVAAFIDCQKPLIVLANGPAVGIAVTTMGLADIVYTTDKAHFSTPFSSLGQSPEACSSYTFPKIMGYAKSSELLYFNSRITAQQAQAAGLVTEVFPEDTFIAETTKRVQSWAKLPVKSLVYSKDLVRGPERKLLHDVNEAEAERLLERWQSEDCMKAIMKFFSKSKK